MKIRRGKEVTSISIRLEQLLLERKMKKVEKSLYKYLCKECYCDWYPDMIFWAEISRINIGQILGTSKTDGYISFIVKFGRKCNTRLDFSYELSMYVLDGSIKFILGQILGEFYVFRDSWSEFKLDGIEYISYPVWKKINGEWKKIDGNKQKLLVSSMYI